MLRLSRALVLLGLVWVVVLVVALKTEWSTRRSEFEALAGRAQPLIDAIERYEQHSGHPPRKLADLVPDCLPLVPGTGHPQYPHFEYEVLDPSLGSSPWELRVPCSTGFGNWDEFFYWPTEEYPEQTGRGSIERIGRWAYLNE